MRNHRRTLAALLLALFLLPAGSLAAPMGECIHFNPEKPFEAEFFSIASIVVTRMMEEYVMLDVYYTLPEELTPEERRAVDGVKFCLVQGESSTEYLRHAVARADYAFTERGAVEWTGPDREMESVQAIQPKATLEQESQWEGMDALPGILYIRPYYPSIDTWGEVLVLDTAAGMKLDVESRNSLPPPLTEKEARKNGNG